MDKIGVSFDVYVDRLAIGGREVPITEKRKGSPTTTFAQDLMSMLATGSPYIAIDKLAVVDINGQERDYCDTSSGLSRSTVGSNRVIFQCSVTATASYQFNKARLYSGTKKYFETPLPATYSVSQGQQVSVSISVDINVTMGETISNTGILQNATSRSAQGFIDALRSALTSQKRYRIYQVRATPGGAMVTISVGCQAAATSITCTGSTSVGFSCGDPQTPCPADIAVDLLDVDISVVLGDAFHHVGLQIAYLQPGDIIYARVDVQITSQLAT